MFVYSSATIEAFSTIRPCRMYDSFLCNSLTNPCHPPKSRSGRRCDRPSPFIADFPLYYNQVNKPYTIIKLINSQEG